MADYREFEHRGGDHRTNDYGQPLWYNVQRDGGPLDLPGKPTKITANSAGGITVEHGHFPNGVVLDKETPDMVNHPPHYTSSPAKCAECGHQIECIEITEHMSFCVGNAVKYLWRSDMKGVPIEDLEKAVWYIKREIEKRSRA